MLVLKNYRYQVKASWAGFDFIAPYSAPAASDPLHTSSLVSQLGLVHAAIVSPACLPASQWRGALDAVQLMRPAGYPGNQSVAAGRVAFCTGDGTNPGECWPKEQVQILQDIVLNAYSSGMDVRFIPAGYVVVVRNGVVLCNTLVTDACVAEVGADTCVQQAIASGTHGVYSGNRSAGGFAFSAAPGRDGGGDASESKTTLAIAIGVPVGRPIAALPT